jgi:hypothetical protein
MAAFNPNLFIIDITDEHGEQWKAEQLTGAGAGPTHDELTSYVRFTSNTTGQVLDGRVGGLLPADKEELLASLREAKRIAAYQSLD